MGIQLEIGGAHFEPENFTVSEEITPIAAGDSSGSVGSFSFELKGVEDPLMLSGKTVSLRDSDKGSTLGFVTGVDWTDHGSVKIDCQSRLGKLNIYDVQAAPFVGTLEGAFRYYAGLAGEVADVFVDPQIATRPVTFPGWFGELWFHVKQFAAAQDCEVSLVSGVVLLRPLRKREAVDDFNISRSRSYGNSNLSRAVEVYHYANRAIYNELVYPSGGWVPETDVITVNAGEERTVTLPLSASVSSIVQPTMQTFVAQDYRASSVYTVVGDDGLPIQPAQWRDFGGEVRVFVGQDTQSLEVYFRGAEGITSSKGEPISSYALALGSDFTGNRYSTLRITGTGVAYNKELLRIRTGIPDSMTGTDIGITIDNPFISTMADAYTAGIRAARWHAGERMVLRGQVTSINRSGDTGDATFPTYQYDQNKWQGKTYAQVESSVSTYATLQDLYWSEVESDFSNQVYGNTGGARVWDRNSNRWYRVRTGQISRGSITIDAEDDLTHLDIEATYTGLSYAQERALFPGATYSERDRRGMSK